MLSNSITIGTHTFLAGSPCIIAEAGTAHGGNLQKAFELVDAARESGAHCVKFQHVYADEIIHPRTGNVPLPGGSIPLFDRFKALEQAPDFFYRIKEYCIKKNIIFLCTPFGIRSARELRDIGVEAIKIASPELNYTQLLREVATYAKPVLLSSGVTTLADIDRALTLLKDIPKVVLHCITAYPAPEEEYNINLVTTLHAITGIPCGLSDHSLHPTFIPGLSLACGAVVLEKHLCLSRQDDGLDDPIALEPKDFAIMTSFITSLQGKSSHEILTIIQESFGKERTEKALGTGIKQLAPSEYDNYGRTNRSLHVLTTIRPGTVFTEQNVAILRTEKILKPGLAPEYLPVVLGRTSRNYIEAGDGISWQDIGDYA
mgnify:CR=1 FL=1